MHRRTLDSIQTVPVTIQRDRIVKGDIRGECSYVIHGRVVGDSDLDGAIMIAESAFWLGNINAEMVVVKGRVKGNIVANSKIELRPGSQVMGSLSAPFITIAEGANLVGDIDEVSMVTHYTESRTH
ncbi:MAG: polymer-forming cytoskeletal protein [Gammaproteobacteria bacterium]|nr:polymer-forming cytoskeletal protein [Gammaproteobacteria bacterium]